MGLTFARFYAEMDAQPAPSSTRARRDRHRRNLGRRRDIRQYRPAGRSACLRKAGADARADQHSGDPARPPRCIFRDIGRDRLVDREYRDRDPAHAAHRGSGSRGVLRQRPEGLVRDAPQAQSHSDRKPHRPGAAGAHGGGARDGKRALWHERDISHSSVERNIGPDTTITWISPWRG